jgi:hypothetical protein
MACVEFGRGELHSLPTGAALGSQHVVPAQYHSAALVFAAQALLDNIAEWLRERLTLAITHPQTAFHKPGFRAAIAAADGALGAIIDNHGPFIDRLERFRHAWIHRISGGARLYSDSDWPQNPSSLRIAVPIDPKIGTARGQEELEAIDACKLANAGRWLYDIGEFADRFADGTKGLVLAVLSHELART